MQQTWTSNLPTSFLTWLNGRKVEEVECIVSDLAGIARGKAMPARKFAKSGDIFLPISIYYQTITGDYTEMEIDNQWTERDMLLKPDLSTATCAPWSSDISLQVIHDPYDQDGEPIQMAPRNVLKRVLAAYHAEGWEPVIAPEMEFYLTKPNTNPNHPIEPPIGRTGRTVARRQAYSMSAVDDYGPVIDDIYDFAEAQGFEIDTIIQEGGSGQIEINLNHGNPLTLADQVFFFKRTIREAALRNNCFATFMAKPMQDEPGSAMHIHHSIKDIKTGKNLFTDDAGEATDYFHHFIAGLQKNIPKAICMMAPYVNSYRRYVPGESAPINLEWGADNRTTGIRVPISNPQNRRVENRVVGMDANPYLAIASSLACGLIGLRNKLQPKRIFKGEADTLEHALPRGLLEALQQFPEQGELVDLLGPEFCPLYRSIKTQEIEEFLQVISPWEREYLLLHV